MPDAVGAISCTLYLYTHTLGTSHMAEYTCCSSVAFERPNENTFTFTFPVPSPCCQVLELIAIPATGAPEGTQADCDYWWTKFMDAGGVTALWRVVRGSVAPDTLDLASGSVFAAACVAVAAKLLDYAHEVRACARALDLQKSRARHLCVSPYHINTCTVARRLEC
jgi:hypothetical protein